MGFLRYSFVIIFSLVLNTGCNSPSMESDDEAAKPVLCHEMHQTEKTPYIVMILFRKSGRLLCMGSIINKYHVLTAKSCFKQADSLSLMVVAGYRSPHFGRHSQVKFVQRLIYHPVMDLAMLLLKKPFTFTNTVKPIRILGPKLDDEIFTMHKTWMVAGFVLPELASHRGDTIPRGNVYQVKEEGTFLDVDEDCEEQLHIAGSTFSSLNEKVNYCSMGATKFCWTALGSPAVVLLDGVEFQIAVIIFAECRYLPPTSEPTAREKEPESDFSPYIYLRLDVYWSWVQASS